jgi:hypothetical protein
MDVADALLLVSPTPFSVYGVMAMWAAALTAGLVALRRRLPLRPATWAALHTGLAGLVVLGTVIHALQIEGTMEPISKWALCGAALAATGAALAWTRILRPRRRRRPPEQGRPRTEEPAAYSAATSTGGDGARTASGTGRRRA